MKICWMYFKEEWAFKIICERYAKAMPNDEHVFNQPEGADVVFAVTTPMLHALNIINKNVILHLDSFRALRI